MKLPLRLPARLQLRLDSPPTYDRVSVWLDDRKRPWRFVSGAPGSIWDVLDVDPSRSYTTEARRDGHFQLQRLYITFRMRGFLWWRRSVEVWTNVGSVTYMALISHLRPLDNGSPLTPEQARALGAWG